jgi:hypothetical protein
VGILSLWSVGVWGRETVKRRSLNPDQIGDCYTKSGNLHWEDFFVSKTNDKPLEILVFLPNFWSSKICDISQINGEILQISTCDG